MSFSMPRSGLALLPLLLAACSTTPLTTPAAAPASSAPVAAAPAPSTATPAPVAPARPVAAHLDPSSPLSRERSVFFDFDSSVVKPEFTPVIERHGQYLAGNGNLKVRVEGNTDERGGTEYNLALGQRRAESVVKVLQLQGAKASQLEAVSYGKERPKSTGSGESAWQHNRRADIVYATGR